MCGMPRHLSLLLQKYLQELFGWHLGLLPDHRGHGGPWGQLGIAARLLHLVQLKDSRLLSSEVSPDSAERGRQGLSRAATDLTSATAKSLACHFDIHAALIWIRVGGPPKGGAGTPFLFLFAKSLEKAHGFSSGFVLCRML